MPVSPPAASLITFQNGEEKNPKQRHKSGRKPQHKKNRRASPKTPGKEKQPDRSEQPPAYDLAEDDEIGMVECTVDSILNQ